MKVAKIKKNKKEKINNQNLNSEYSIKNLVLIILILSVIFVVFYFITTLIIDGNNNKNKDSNVNSVIDSSKITLNQIFTRSEDEYYVLSTQESLYKSDYTNTSYAQLYNNYINKYIQNENSLKFYYVDLDNALNKNYLSDDVNISNNLNELKLNDEALFKIKDGKIEKSYIGKEEILNALSKLN